MPDFSFENEITQPTCGIDEVGRGPLAGPVVAACVFIPEKIRTHEFIKQIQDSKKISEGKRLNLYAHITEHCPYGIGQCSPQEIDKINIFWATMQAMERAYAQMRNHANSQHANYHCLIDGNKLPTQLAAHASAIVKGDGRSVSIAAASIVAKVTRDKIMTDLAAQYPVYGWERNAAYPTKEHLLALSKHGITSHHRQSFKPVKALLCSSS